MTGDFRIAVMGFAEEQNVEKGTGTELANSVYQRLTENFEQMDWDVTVSIWGPDRVGKVSGETNEERAKVATELAERIGAHLVVYGLVESAQAGWIVIPEFVVSTTSFFEAQEVTGPHELGTPLSINGQDPIVTSIEVSKQYRARVEALSRIAIGLAYYSVDRYAEALSEFELALQVEDWQEDRGKEIVYLLMGNAAGKNNELSLAGSYHEAALGIAPNYARAHIGLASTYYLLALSDYTRSLEPDDIDAELLRQAIGEYELAQDTTPRPTVSDMSGKVNFGLGQCYLMLSLTDDSNYLELAVEKFNAVLTAYAEDSNINLRELVAESHARLALIALINNQPQEAVREYEAAVQLLYDKPERQAYYEAEAKEIQLRIDSQQK